ncbi:MAG: glycosyltransferase [Pseudomonadota bacterium]
MDRFESVAVVMPVLDDWPSLAKLISDVEDLRGPDSPRFVYVAADDGSRNGFADSDEDLPYGVELHVVKLKANQGHQRAIALGLAYVERSLHVEAVVVMDSDGEDLPTDVYRLINQAQANPGALVCAKRAKRSEGLAFRLCYTLYRWVFQMLTGKTINFGNFSLIPTERLPNILYNQGIWNNLAATMLRSRVPMIFEPTERGSRYFGESRMNFVGLVLHGISVISVFSDVVIARIVILLTMLFAVLTLGILVTLGIKLEGSVFIPGYATTVILFLANMIVTSLFIGFAVVIMLLNTRVLTTSLPSQLFDDLVLRTERFGTLPTPTNIVGAAE